MGKQANELEESSADIDSHEEQNSLLGICIQDAKLVKQNNIKASSNVGDKIPPIQRFKAIAQDIIFLCKWKGYNKVTRKNINLLLAAQEGETERAKELLENGASQNATYEKIHLSACHIAALFGRNEILEMLIEKEANFNILDKEGRRPIEFAAWEGHWKCVDILSKAKESDKYSHIPIKHLAPLNCPIIEENISKIWSKCSPLHLASARLHVDCVKILLKNCPGMVFAKNPDGLTPLDLCARKFISDSYELNEFVKMRFDEVIQEFINSKQEHRINGDIQNSMKIDNNTHIFDTPLHIAVMLDNKRTLQILHEEVKAFFGCKNKLGQTPLHIAAINKRERALTTLASICAEEYKLGDEFDILNMVDNQKYTSLHLAVKNKWLTGVRILLDVSNVALRDGQGNSILHLAIEAGDLEILKELLINKRVMNKWEKLKNDTNLEGETPLHTAIRCKSIEGVKTLLVAKVSCEIELNNLNVYHKAAEAGNLDVLNELIDSKQIDVKKLYELGGPHKVSPLHLAAENNNFACIEKFLITSSDRTQCNQKSFAPPYSEKIANSQKEEWLPFHVAVENGHKESIALFLKYDADIAQVMPTTGNHNKKAFDKITSKMHNPADYLEELCSSCIKMNEYHLDDPQCEITIDYSFLLPPQSDNTLKEYGKRIMRIVKVLTNPTSNYALKRLILHPLIESFQYMQYTALKKFFFYILLTYCSFVITLTVSVIIEYKYKDSADGPPTMLSKFIWHPILWITMFLVLIQEMLFIAAKKMERLKKHETIIKLGSLSLSMVFTMLNHNVTSVFPRYVTAGAILLAWVEIIILLSRFPEFGYLYQMFTTVALRVVKVMALFGCFMIIGFSLAFWVLFNSKPPFDGPWNSIVKTMVMMTSEFDYSDMIGHSTWAAYPSFPQIMFVAFLISMPIVVMNLLIALAISDTKDLEVEGKIQRLLEQLEFLCTLDLIGCTKIWSYFPEFIKTYKKSELAIGVGKTGDTDKTNETKKIKIKPCIQDKRFTKSILASIYEAANNQRHRGHVVDSMCA